MTQQLAAGAMARVLIVDDDRAVAYALSRTLRGLGYPIVGTASSGAEAVKLAEELKPDIILMDIRLGPGLSGIDATKKIRSFDDAQVIYLSASYEDGALAQARATNPAGYLQKPCTKEELHEAIQLALAARDHDPDAVADADGSSREKTPPYGTRIADLRKELAGKSAEEIALFGFMASEEAARRGAYAASVSERARHGTEDNARRLERIKGDLDAFRAENQTALGALGTEVRSNGDKVMRLYEEIVPALSGIPLVAGAIPFMAMAIRDLEARVGAEPAGRDMRSSYQGEQTAAEITRAEKGSGLAGKMHELAHLAGHDMAARKIEAAELQAQIRQLMSDMAKSAGRKAGALAGAAGLITAPTWIEPLAKAMSKIDITTPKGIASASLAALVILVFAIVAIRRRSQPAGSV